MDAGAVFEPRRTATSLISYSLLLHELDPAGVRWRCALMAGGGPMSENSELGRLLLERIDRTERGKMSLKIKSLMAWDRLGHPPEWKVRRQASGVPAQRKRSHRDLRLLPRTGSPDRRKWHQGDRHAIARVGSAAIHGVGYQDRSRDGRAQGHFFEAGEYGAPVLTMDTMRAVLRSHPRSIHRELAASWLGEARVELGQGEPGLVWLEKELTRAFA
jgi:hypothetical protein